MLMPLGLFIIYLVPIMIYAAFTLPALYSLRNAPLDETHRFLWTVLALVPIIGPIAYAIIKPGTYRA